MRIPLQQIKTYSFYEKPNKNNIIEESSIWLKKRFYLQKLIGKGQQGVVFSALDSLTKTKVAIKIIDKHSVNDETVSDEIKILKKLNKIPNFVGFPYLINTGMKKNYYFVTELLGESLMNLQSKYHAKHGMRMKHALMIGMQLLKRIRDFHSIGYVHCDIKPGNIVFGRNKRRNILYLVDYGLSRLESKTRTMHVPKHIFDKSNLRLNGTPLYASINLHLGWSKVFKKDDIESFIYMLINLIKGSLPWFNLPIVEGANYSNILQAKISAKADDLWKDLPSAIKDIYLYVRKLQNLETIDYDYIDKWLHKAAKQWKLDISSDHSQHMFHWLLEEKRYSKNCSTYSNLKRLPSVDSLLYKSESDDFNKLEKISYISQFKEESKSRPKITPKWQKNKTKSRRTSKLKTGNMKFNGLKNFSTQKDSYSTLFNNRLESKQFKKHKLLGDEWEFNKKQEAMLKINVVHQSDSVGSEHSKFWKLHLSRYEFGVFLNCL